MSSWGRSWLPGSQRGGGFVEWASEAKGGGSGTAVLPCIWKDQQVPLGNGSWGSRGGF